MIDSKRPVIIFDDVFFTLSESGIAKYWLNIMREFELLESSKDLPFEMVTLNRSGKFQSSIFKKIDFPKWDQKLTATDRINISKVAKDWNATYFLSSYDTFCQDVINIKVVFDTIPEVFGFSRKNRTWLERELSIFRANKIICISQSTQSDMQKIYPTLTTVSDQIVYPGLDTSVFFPSTGSEILEFKKSIGMPNYILYVGARGRESDYKNAKLLFKAFEHAVPQDFSVLFVGGEVLSEDEIESLNRYKIKYNQIFPLDSELRLIYSSADCLVSTSLYEGFGMPVLEALACGTPVITTQTSSLPESSGGLGLKISGFNPQELYEAIKLSQGAEFRTKFRTQGIEHSKTFSWSDSANILLSQILTMSRDFNAPSKSLNKIFVDYDELMVFMEI